jgi:aconitate hydratase
LDLTSEPLANDIYLKDLWPSNEEVNEYVAKFVTPEIFANEYQDVFAANEKWNEISTSAGEQYEWNEESTYIANPPYFDRMALTEDNQPNLENLLCLAKFGDSVTTDHISPAGAIGINSPAGRYLREHGVEPQEFNSFGSRRGHHEVMMRGTFGNIRINNALADGKVGGFTKNHLNGEITSIYEAAMEYQKAGCGTVVIAGNDYGMGSSRDWAAKGTNLLGVKAVLAKSYERIHRSNLVMMGVLPLQFMDGEDVETLGLTGEEAFTIKMPMEYGINDVVEVTTDKGQAFKMLVRFDTPADIRYYQNGGILPLVIRKKLGK